jgi:hypothetical protein
MSYIQDTNKICRFGEKIFNVGECIPVVGVAVSIGRIQASYWQELIAVTTIAVGSFTLLSALVFKKDEQTKEGYRKIVCLGAEQLLQGVLNTLHGYGVLIFSCATLGLGNAFLVIPHLMNKDKFGPYVRYGFLTEPNKVVTNK